MKAKTSELTDRALDWAVGEALGAYKGMVKPYANSDREEEALIFPGGVPCKWLMGEFNPSVRWDQCGALVEKYGVWLSDDEEEGGLTHIASIQPHMDNAIQKGETQLIAICRAVVASVLGDEIDLTDGLQ